MSDPWHIPDFFVIGVQKAGTSTLHEWLRAQPGVCLPTIKETHFFSDEATYARGVDEYRRWFNCSAGAVVGEVDPEYLFFPQALPRIAEQTNEARFIVILRNPYDRAYSHYLMTQRRGYEPLDFSMALLAEEERLSNGGVHAFAHHSYLARSNYGDQLQRLSECFPEADCLYLNFDEMVAEATRAGVFAKVCRFIGLDLSLIDESVLCRRSNEAGVPRFAFVRDFLYAKSTLRHMLGRLIPSQRIKLRIALLIDKLNTGGTGKKTPYDMSDFTPEMRARIDQQLHRAQEYSGLDLSSWLSDADFAGGE